MAITERLALLITADGSGAVREMDKVGRAAERSLGSAESRTERLGATFVSVGTKMMIGGAIVGAAMWKMGSSAANAAEQADWAARVFGDSFDEIDRWAQGASTSAALSQTAAHEAAAGFGVLLRATGKSNDELADMSINFAQLAADMSSAKDVPIEQSLNALQSALAGQSRPMRAFGVMLDDVTLKQRALDMGLISTTSGTLPQAIRMQAAYAEIMEQTAGFQGNFADTADSVANRQRTMAAEWSNLTDEIGTSFLPVMEGVISTGTGLINVLGGMNEATGGLLGKIGTGATLFLTLGGAALFTAGKVMQLSGSMIDGVKSANSFLRTHAGMSRALGAGAVAAGLFAGAMYLIERSNSAAAASGRLIVDNFLEPMNRQIADGQINHEQYRSKLAEIERQIHSLGEQHANTSRLRTTEANQINAVRNELIDQAHAMQRVEIRARELADATQQPIDAAIAWVTEQEILGNTFHRSSDWLQAYQRSLLETAGVTPDAAQEIAGLGQEFVDTELAISEAEDALKSWSDELKAQFDPLFGYADALDKNAEAQRKLAEAQRDLDAARASGDLDEIIAKERDLESALFDVVKSASALDQAMVELSVGLENGTVDLDASRAMLERWVAQGSLTEQQAAEAAHEFEVLAARAREADSTDVMITANVDTAAAHDQINHLINRLDIAAQKGGIGGMVMGFASTTVKSKQDVQPRARGGPLSPGSVALVGEEGPELMVMGTQQATVINNSQTKQVLSGGGGSDRPLVVNVMIDGDKVGRAVLPSLRNERAGRT